MSTFCRAHTACLREDARVIGLERPERRLDIGIVFRPTLHCEDSSRTCEVELSRVAAPIGESVQAILPGRPVGDLLEPHVHLVVVSPRASVFHVKQLIVTHFVRGSTLRVRDLTTEVFHLQAGGKPVVTVPL